MSGIELTVRIPEGVTSPAVDHYLAEHPGASRAEAYRTLIHGMLGGWVDVDIVAPAAVPSPGEDQT